MYLTFAQYGIMGGGLNEAAFSRLEFQARTLIDRQTFGRLKKDSVYSEAVQRLIFELIGLIGNNDTSAADYTPAVQSEGNDGYNISFSSGTIMTLEQAEAAKADLISQYLGGERNQTGALLLCRWA